MAGILHHTPADILRRGMILLGLGVDPPASDADEWPIYSPHEPDRPDNCITVRGTLGRKDGRLHPSGQVAEHHGVQIRLRCQTDAEGYAKARAVAIVLDEGIYQLDVVFGGYWYRIHSVNRTTDVLQLGMEVGVSKRSLFTFNTLLCIQECGTGTGTGTP